VKVATKKERVGGNLEEAGVGMAEGQLRALSVASTAFSNDSS